VPSDTAILIGFAVFVVLAVLVAVYHHRHRSPEARERDAERRRQWTESSRASKGWMLAAMGFFAVALSPKETGYSPWWVWACWPATFAAIGLSWFVDRHRRRR
jgi:hypothetical protein